MRQSTKERNVALDWKADRSLLTSHGASEVHVIESVVVGDGVVIVGADEGSTLCLLNSSCDDKVWR